MKMRTPVLAVALAALATPAVSLSCMRPDVARSYGYAADAEELYVVVHGTLHFNEARLPESTGNNSPDSTKLKARLTGNSLSKEGFTHRFDRDITLDVTCLGPWCADARSGTKHLAFLRKDGNGYTYTLDPCGSLGFERPTPEMLQQAEQCMAGGPCKPARR